MMSNGVSIIPHALSRCLGYRWLALAWLLCLPAMKHVAGAGTITSVMPGEGTLEAAIAAAAAGDVLRLTGGAEYQLSAGSTTFGLIDRPLALEVEPGATSHAVIRLSGNPSTSKIYFFKVTDGASLTLRGLDIYGLHGGSPFAASMIVFDARPAPSDARIGTFVFENCVFHDFVDYIVHGMKDDWARGAIQEAVLIDNVVVFNAKHFLQYKHVSLRRLEMMNSTVYNLQGMAVKIGKIGYRCVLETPGKPYVPVSDETITPTGFIDRCTFDNLGDTHGHIQVDDAYHLLRISNCIISHQQQYLQPAVYFLQPTIDPTVQIENTVFWDVGPPNSEVGGEDWIGYEFEETATMDLHYANAAGGDYTLPSSSPLFTLGNDGGPVGDPRWTANRLFTGSIWMELEKQVGLHIPALHPDWRYVLEGSPNLEAWIQMRTYTRVSSGIPWPVRDLCAGPSSDQWFFRLRRELPAE